MLALSSVSLRNTDGSNVTVFDVDPTSYDPLNVPRRGSVHKTLDGGAVFQSFGVRQRDFVINLQGQIVELDTLAALHDKFRVNAEYELRDWYGNRFLVVFVPGSDSFHPTPIIGSCTAWTYSMNLQVCTVLQWFGGSSPF